MQSAQIPTSQTISIFSQIWLDSSNCHIFPAMLYSNEVKIEGGRAHTNTGVRYNFLHFSQQYTVHIMARRGKNRAGFSHVRVCGLGQTNFSQVICAYIQSRRRCVAQERRGGSNQLRAYLAYGGRKLGSNRHRWRDMTMMQSVLITCLSYII